MNETVDLDDPVLRRWINPIYLERSRVEDIRESVLAKPVSRYAVLDGFFEQRALKKLVERHMLLSFSEPDDRLGSKGELLPYDSAVKWANESDVGGDLFFNLGWGRYCAYLVGSELRRPGQATVKLRYHRPNANGFWIHTDSADRALVAIAYFNSDWKASDGGLLQLWRVDEVFDHNTPLLPPVQPNDRLDFLHSSRLKIASPGGGWRAGEQGPRDLVLMDQIVPAYNRLFLCSFQHDPAYHSVTPSNGRARTGFVQWFV